MQKYDCLNASFTSHEIQLTFAVHRRREFYLLDQQARERKHQADYKRHVHMPPTQPAITITTKNVTHHRCN